MIIDKKTRYDVFLKLQNVCATSLNITKCLNISIR